MSISERRRDTAYRICIEILQFVKWDISLKGLLRNASDANEQVARYLGKDLALSRNWNARNLLTRLLNHTCVKQIEEKPLVLKPIQEKDTGTTRGDSCNTAAVDNDGNIG